MPENHVSIADVSSWGGTKGQDAASCNSVTDKAGFDEVGMDLLEVFHVGTLFFKHGEVWSL